MNNCLWEYQDNGIEGMHKGKILVPVMHEYKILSPSSFKYCPCCGKEIKIKEDVENE